MKLAGDERFETGQNIVCVIHKIQCKSSIGILEKLNSARVTYTADWLSPVRASRHRRHFFIAGVALPLRLCGGGAAAITQLLWLLPQSWASAQRNQFLPPFLPFSLSHANLAVSAPSANTYEFHEQSVCNTLPNHSFNLLPFF